MVVKDLSKSFNPCPKNKVVAKIVKKKFLKKLRNRKKS